MIPISRYEVRSPIEPGGVNVFEGEGGVVWSSDGERVLRQYGARGDMDLVFVGDLASFEPIVEIVLVSRPSRLVVDRRQIFVPMEMSEFELLAVLDDAVIFRFFGGWSVSIRPRPRRLVADLLMFPGGPPDRWSLRRRWLCLREWPPC